MKTIWKYPLEPFERTLNVPANAQLLTVQTQKNIPCLWFLVELDQAEPTETRRFTTYGTGHTIPDGNRLYVGTTQMHDDALVFHVFEELD